MSAKTQKRAVKQLLETIFPNSSVEKERTFTWGNVTATSAQDYADIFEPLHQSRGYTAEQFAKPRAINYDFVVEDKKLIIEYDEKQHFTIQRKISLENYPDDIKLYYDKAYWVSECERIHAKDNDPPYRDEQRAFRDSIRDIAAYVNGYKLIRIKHGNYDFESADGERYLRDILAKYGVI